MQLTRVLRKRMAAGLLAGAIATPAGSQMAGPAHAQRENVRQHASPQLIDARQNFALRQGYLDRLLAGERIPYCERVVYDHDGTKILAHMESRLRNRGHALQHIPALMQPHRAVFLGGNYQGRVPHLLEQIGEGRYTTIFLGRDTFEVPTHLTDADLKHLIVAHEGRHAEQHAKGFPFMDNGALRRGLHDRRISPDAMHAVMELDANYAALQRIGEFQTSAGRASEVRRTISSLMYELRERAATTTGVQKTFVENALRYAGVRR